MEEVDDYNSYHIAFKFDKESNCSAYRERKVCPCCTKLENTGNHIHVLLCTLYVDTDK